MNTITKYKRTRNKSQFGSRPYSLRAEFYASCCVSFESESPNFIPLPEFANTYSISRKQIHRLARKKVVLVIRKKSKYYVCENPYLLFPLINYL